MSHIGRARSESGAPWIQCHLDAVPSRVVMGGEIDNAASPLLSKALKSLTGRRAGDVIADLEAVTFLSCIGVEFLVRLAEGVHARGGEVYVLASDPTVLRMLSLTGTTQEVGILKSQVHDAELRMRVVKPPRFAG
jgi:anti-anti-sigma factor